MMQSLAAVLECPVCLDQLCPPIHSCCQGHSVCNNCKPGLTACPICRQPITGRNTSMEHVLEVCTGLRNLNITPLVTEEIPRVEVPLVVYTWQCKKCTYENELSLDTCEVCNESKAWWKCAECSQDNPGSMLHCLACGYNLVLGVQAPS